MRRPLIGIPGQTLQVIDGVPSAIPHSWVMNHRYFHALAGSGALPVMVPLLHDDLVTLRGIFDRLDGIFLPGGVDLDPASYGAERDALCGPTDAARDRVELQLTRWAMAEGMPIFGVCRGMQVMNVAAGGTLIQDCAYVAGAGKHDYFPTQGYARDHLAHTVELVDGTRLRQLFGVGVIHVNSMHHQGVERLGEGLLAAGRAPDGVLEAIEGAEDAFRVGALWHPEMLLEREAGTRRLFAAFVEAAADFGERDWPE